MISTLLTVFIVICIIGLILWGIGQVPGIPQIVKVVIYVIIGVILLVWLLQYVQGGHLSTLHWRTNMLSVSTLTTIEALLLSRNDPRWGEFMLLAQTIGEVQKAKQEVVLQARVQPAPAAKPVVDTEL
jgi:hypothetical protein